MRILVTGHDGYIGTRLVPLFLGAGHEVVGVDSGLFSDCAIGEEPPAVESLWTDVRDLTPDQLQG
nr:NAD-dependent epimerase/dehydratase family protein [Micromonospora sp. DSM 115978]